VTRSRVSHSESTNNVPAAADFQFGANAPPETPAPAPPEPAAEPAGRPAAAAAPDPFDPETYRLCPDLAAATGVRKVMTELPVRPPNKAWWVRVHPDKKYRLQAHVVELKEEGETYLVLPPLWRSLAGEPTFRPKCFHLAVTMQGKHFLWPVRVPTDASKEPDRWMRTPLEAVLRAQKSWVRITWNEETRQHDLATCEAADEPEWPDLSMRDLVALAFKDYVIDRLDHPVLRRLRGESS
jgi:hypothetical protein